MWRPGWRDVRPWLVPLLVALVILAVAWLLWPALRQEQRPTPMREKEQHYVQ
jgi:hypothetical protein